MLINLQVSQLVNNLVTQVLNRHSVSQLITMLRESLVLLPTSYLSGYYYSANNSLYADKYQSFTAGYL